MRVRTRLLLGLLPSLALLLAMAVVLAVTQRALEDATAATRLAEQILRAVLETSLARSEFLASNSPRDAREWQARHDELGKLVSAGGLGNASERQLLAAIDQLNREAEPLFRELAALYAGAEPPAANAPALRDAETRLVERLSILSERRAAHAARLAELGRARLDRWQRRSHLFVFAAAFLVAALALLNSWFVLRYVLRPIAALRSGVGAVGGGDLEHRVASGAHDEVGELARAFDEMTRSLQARTRELEESLRREQLRARQLRGLAQVAQTVNASRSITDILQCVTDQSRLLIGAHQAVTSFTQDRNWAQAITGLSLSDKYAAYRSYDARPDGSGIYSLVCETNRPLRMTQAELEAHPRWRGFGSERDRHPPMRGWLAAPLVSQDGRNLGLVQVSDKEEGEFTAEDEAVLVQLAQMASVALEVRYFQEKLEQRVAERTAELAERTKELERFNRLATGRELRMIELKRRINELSRALGEPAPYDVSFAEEDNRESKAS